MAEAGPARGGWFKLFDDMLDDPKLADLSPAQCWVWTALLCLANRSDPPGEIRIGKGLGYTIQQLARDTKSRMSEERMQATLDVFVSRRMLKMSRSGVICVTNWARRQRMKPSDLPEATRERQRRRRGKSANAVTPSPRDEGVTVTPTDRQTDKTDRVKEEGCGWCRRPQPANAAPLVRLMQHFHDSYRERFGSCQQPAGDDFAAVKRRLKVQPPEEIVKRWSGKGGYLESEDPLVHRNGHSIRLFCGGQIFDGIGEAQRKGEIHGADSPHGRRPAGQGRTKAPTPADAFRETREIIP